MLATTTATSDSMSASRNSTSVAQMSAEQMNEYMQQQQAIFAQADEGQSGMHNTQVIIIIIIMKSA